MMMSAGAPIKPLAHTNEGVYDRHYTMDQELVELASAILIWELFSSAMYSGIHSQEGSLIMWPTKQDAEQQLQ